MSEDIAKDRDKDARKDYRWITEKQPENETKRAFYIYSSIMLGMLVLFSAVVVFIPLEWRYSLLFIATDMTIISFLLVLIKYRKDEFLVDFLGYVGIFSVAAILIPGILIFINDSSNEVDYASSTICISSIFVFFPIFVIWYYRKLELRKKAIVGISKSVMKNRTSLDNLTLKAKWKFPIISPEEWEESMHEMKKEAKSIGYTSIISGFILIFLTKLEYLLFFNTVLTFSGYSIIVFGLYVSLIEIQIKRQLKEKDEIYMETEAPWDIEDLEEGKEAVEKFLAEKGYSYKLRRAHKSDYSSEYYEYKYFIGDSYYVNVKFGKRMSCGRYTGCSTYTIGGVIIGYKLLNYNEARELQQELDEYLTEKGIIKKREASKKRNGRSIRVR